MRALSLHSCRIHPTFNGLGLHFTHRSFTSLSILKDHKVWASVTQVGASNLTEHTNTMDDYIPALERELLGISLVDLNSSFPVTKY